MKKIKIGGPAILLISLVISSTSAIAYAHFNAEKEDEVDTATVAIKEPKMVKIECYPDMYINTIDLIKEIKPTTYTVEEGIGCAEYFKDLENEREESKQEMDEKRIEEYKKEPIKVEENKNMIEDLELKIDEDGIIFYADNVPDVLEIPDFVDGIEVKEVSNRVFLNSGIKSLKLPDTITFIGSEAFKNNHIKELQLPDIIEVIGAESFSENEITNLKLPSSLRIIENEAFSFNSIESLFIPASIEEIDYKAFFENDITELIIENGRYTTVRNETFSSNRLETVNIPSNIDTISESAFDKNVKIYSNTLPY